MSNFGYGSTGQVLTSNGAGVMPSFQAASGGSQLPIFFARSTNPQNNVTGDGTSYVIQYDTTDYNVGTCFNTATGQFTVPSTDVFRFEMGITILGVDSTNTSINWVVIDNTTGFNSNIYYLQPQPYTVSTNIILNSLSYLVPSTLTAGDVITTFIQCSGVSTNVSLYANAGSNSLWWAAYKLS